VSNLVSKVTTQNDGVLGKIAQKNICTQAEVWRKITEKLHDLHFASGVLR
jgi:hypothetical protein